MKKIINRALSVILCLTLLIMMVFTVVPNCKDLAYGALVSYVQYLPDDPNVFDTISASIQSFTNVFNHALLGKDAFQRFNAQLQLFLGKQMLSFGDKTMVRLTTGQLYDTMDACDVTGELDKMATMNDYLSEKGIPFLFVYAHTMLYEDGMLPFGADDHNIEVADDIVNGLRERGIDTIDSRETMAASGRPLSEMVFNTDAHWNGYNAFDNYIEVCKWLVQQGISVPEEAYDPSQFETEVYEKRFMGSVGERVGDGYVTPDDFPVITPSYETDITRSHTEEEERGSFKDTVFNMEELYEEGNQYADCYDVYGYHDDAVYFTNHNVEGGRILIIKDSYGTPVSSYLSLAAHEVLAIDLRKTRKSAEDFIEEYQPDAVIIVHCQEMLRGKNYAFVG